MAIQFIQKQSSLGFVENLPGAAGIGFVGGQLYINGNGGPVPLGSGSASLRGVQVVDATLAATVNGVHSTIQAAVDAASAGEDILIAPGEYDEDVTISTAQLRLIGVGARNSVRVTGTAAGTATAVTISGVNEVGLYNLNLEGRSGGSAVKLTGQIRRVQVAGCKLHGGTQAVLIDVPGSSQTVDVYFEGNTIANAATGIFVDYSGGDPCHQIFVLGNVFSKITADCIKEDGATHDWNIIGNVFGNSDGTEATRLLDIDETGTTGVVANNVFGTTEIATGKMAIATGVLFINNRTEQENPGTDAYATNGRPD
jgi:hypothetical protein